MKHKWHSDPLAMLIGTVLAASLAPAPAQAADPAPWSATDKTLLASYVALSAYDAAQTDQCLRANRCVETNPALGSHPSTARLIGTKVIVGAGLYWLADHYPEQRTLLLGIGNVLELAVTVHNASLGFNVKF